ncbi:unnamed protein product [Trifolium pratense]|uniref:Uncharacterized protein n=1 Tax=Trifolium pratense TaxID=57577 RepID=A0ACB0IX12_TRIPR|nr:unnamed protein product [Trifolium pratense]
MGEEMNLNEKSCVSLSPNSVLPSHKYCLNVKKEKAYRNEKFKEYFSEINSSCKSLPCRSHKLEANTENRRGSMYQSSNQGSQEVQGHSRPMHSPSSRKRGERSPRRHMSRILL